MASWNLSMVVSCPYLKVLTVVQIADVSVIMVQGVDVTLGEVADVVANARLV